MTGRRLCAHADADGRGMHWLEPGEKCPGYEVTTGKPCRHEESLYGRCTACGMTWEQQAPDDGAQ